MDLRQLFNNYLTLLFVGATFLSASLANAGEQRLVLTGSSTIAPVALEIGKRFEEQNPGVRVDVQTGGSSRGIADARSGMADIGMASRELAASEQDLHAFPIALDGIALIVHSSNPISNLSNQQIIDIYTGKITHWKQVGGADKSITVVNKAEGRSTLELFLGYFKLTNSQIKASVVIGDNQQGIKTVAGNPFSIGYVSIGTAEYEASAGIPIKLLPMNSVIASVATVQQGEFPLSRPLNLVTREAPSGLLKQFIDFARSDAVSDLILDQYFVPLQAAKKP